MRNVAKGFEKFAKVNSNITKALGFNCVIYTRVSTKEQADNNLSLQTQRKACETYAQKQGYNVLSYFGGTYESAKSDERKEFKRMLDFVKKSKEKVSHIIVYSVDRFSRSGANAIYIASELKKQGITVFAVTQPTDTTTASGSLQQNIHFIFSEYDNQMRREKCIAGTKEKLLMGYWSTKAPLGYDNVKINGEKKIVINEKGKLIKKAFEWKAYEGLTNMQIRDRLADMGLPLHKQMITKIFENPFYCGLITHNMLDGAIVEGKHEKLVSKELFLKVSQLQDMNSQGWKVFEENEQLPLKKFLLCDKCGKPMRGYIVKKKNIHYYKCGTNGCCVNENAKRLNGQFQEMLNEFTFEEKYLPVFRYQLEATFQKFNEDKSGAIETLEKELSDLNKKIERLEERFINEEINRELYEKYITKFKEEKKEIDTKLNDLEFKSSNLNKEIDTALKIAMNLTDSWSKYNYNTKQALQKIVYPEGIYYDKKNGACRTKRVNEVMKLIASFSSKIKSKKEGTTNTNVNQSLCVARTGVEPVTSGL
jgi:site-specific DNA recombinase